MTVKHQTDELTLELVERVNMLETRLGPVCCVQGGCGNIREELDELWELVKRKPKQRDRLAMDDEAMNVAVAAIRFILRK